MSTATSNALTAVAKKRNLLLSRMTDQGRELATKLDTMIGDQARGNIMTWWLMGSRLAGAHASESEYGSGYIRQLAEYLNPPGGATTLYALINFSKAFGRDFVKDNSSKLMSDGRPLELQHWLVLTQVDKADDRVKLLERVLKDCLSARELDREIAAGAARVRNIRHGGRKPQTPTSAVAGLQTLYQISNKLGNLESVVESSIFKKIKEMSDSQVSENLLTRLVQAKDSLNKAKTVTEHMLDKVGVAEKRVRSLLKHEAGEASPESNGQMPATAGKKKSKKKKKRVPVPA